MMNPELLAPAMAQFVLLVVLAFSAAGARISARLGGATKGLAVSAGERNWPGRTQLISSAFNNQFETPAYFFAGLIFAMLADVRDPMLPILAWTYVGSRVIHSIVYVTINLIPLRLSVFLVGFLATAGIWGIVGLNVLAG